MSGGSSDANGNSGANGTPVPWWRKPTVVAIASGAVVTAIGGWLQQGGVSAISSLFSDDESNKPVVHAKTKDTDMCGYWRIHKDAVVVATDLKMRLAGHPSHPAYSKILADGRKATGSDLLTGSTVEVTVEGTNGKAVILTGLDVQVTKREPFNEDVISVGTGCGGGVEERYYSVDLDEPTPHFKLSETDENGQPIAKSVDFPYKVSANDPEVFILSGGALRGAIHWKAVLRWVADGKEGSSEISNGGKPFLSYPVDAPNYWFDTNGDELHLYPSG
ncbi:hypothetical protein OHB14_60580 [Streptomyces sp. NBC_01613]|uniref:hypothetical protein n=1 Tax=Streptomyces sp. NBC_01613 TaxID=2975896 RepID=UPI00386E08E2